MRVRANRCVRLGTSDSDNVDTTDRDRDCDGRELGEYSKLGFHRSFSLFKICVLSPYTNKIEISPPFGRGGASSSELRLVPPEHVTSFGHSVGTIFPRGWQRPCSRNRFRKSASCN